MSEVYICEQFYKTVAVLGQKADIAETFSET